MSAVAALALGLVLQIQVFLHAGDGLLGLGDGDGDLLFRCLELVGLCRSDGDGGGAGHAQGQCAGVLVHSGHVRSIGGVGEGAIAGGGGGEGSVLGVSGEGVRIFHASDLLDSLFRRLGGV